MKSLEDNRKRQKECREKQKARWSELKKDHPEIASKLKICEKSGCPSVIETQPELLSTIVKIATYGAAAAEKRRCETLRTVKTLDELTEALRKEGFNIGRSTVYYHLAPRNTRTVDGKKHVNTVPVDLLRLQKISIKVSMATIDNLKDWRLFFVPQRLVSSVKMIKLKFQLDYSLQMCNLRC